MKYFSYLLAGIFFIIFSCNPSYKKAGEGFEYKIFKGNTDEKLNYGNYLEFHLSQSYQNLNVDTVLRNSRDYMPQIEIFDSTNMPSIYLKILNHAAVGDSIIIRIPTDSAYRPFIARMPAHFKSGGTIYTTIKILNVFKTRDEVDSANLAEFKLNGDKIYAKTLGDFEKKLEKEKEQINFDSKLIEQYLTRKKIKYIKGKWGTFIVIHDEGKGRRITYNDVVGVDYVGKTIDSGRVFDSNLDPKFDHMGTFEVTMSKLENVIPGWTDALLELNEGAKATVYIPSSLAFGKMGKKNKNIKPNESVAFDIAIKGVITEIKAMETVTINRKLAEAAQKKLLDSIKTNK